MDIRDEFIKESCVIKNTEGEHSPLVYPDNTFVQSGELLSREH